MCSRQRRSMISCFFSRFVLMIPLALPCHNNNKLCLKDMPITTEKDAPGVDFCGVQGILPFLAVTVTKRANRTAQRTGQLRGAFKTFKDRPKPSLIFPIATSDCPPRSTCWPGLRSLGLGLGTLAPRLSPAPAAPASAENAPVRACAAPAPPPPPPPATSFDTEARAAGAAPAPRGGGGRGVGGGAARAQCPCWQETRRAGRGWRAAVGGASGAAAAAHCAAGGSPRGRARTGAPPGMLSKALQRLGSAVHRRRMKLLLGIALVAYVACECAPAAAGEPHSFLGTAAAGPGAGELRAAPGRPRSPVPLSTSLPPSGGPVLPARTPSRGLRTPSPLPLLRPNSRPTWALTPAA